MSRSQFFPFHTAHNPIKLNPLNKGYNNILSDWQRLSARDVRIDGRPFKKKDSSAIKSIDDLKIFFLDEILKNVTLIEKDKMADYLLETFHQGGLMFPVLTPLALYFYKLGYGLMNQNATILDIVTTNTGFQVTEIIRITTITEADRNAIMKHNLPIIDNEEGILSASPAQEFLLKVGATFTIDFSKWQPDETSSKPSPGSIGDASVNKTDDPVKDTLVDPELPPHIIAGPSFISYGDSRFKKVIDERTLLQIIIDFFRYYFCPVKYDPVKIVLTVEDEPESANIEGQGLLI